MFNMFDKLILSAWLLVILSSIAAFLHSEFGAAECSNSAQVEGQENGRR